MGVVDVLPLTGFILRRPLLAAPVWRVWLAFSIAWGIYDIVVYWDAAAASPAAQALGTPAFVAAGLAFVLPVWAAVYWYGFRSPALWQGTA